MKRAAGVLLLAVMLFGLWGSGRPVHASEIPAAPRVLLVYDSENRQAGGPEKIDALTRTLASLNIAVTRQTLLNYRAGTLTRQRFQGVITLVNWPQSRVANAAYTRDRQAFTGRQLHIGQNLAADEQRALGSTAQMVTYKQFQLQDPATGAQQVLPFMADQWLLLPAAAGDIGRLDEQGGPRQYAFGLIRGRQAYLPMYSGSGLTGVLSTRLLAQFFTGQAAAQPPVLTLTGVTPVSDLPLLRQATAYLRDQGIPFAISATMTAANNRLPEHAAYLRALAQAQLDGGTVFWQVPVIYAADRRTGSLLQQQFTDQIGQAVRAMVYPVGVSAPGYWQFDTAFSAALHRADQNLLLPNPTTYTLDRGTPTATYAPGRRTFTAIPWRGENTLTGTGDLTFASPTALTLPAPTTAKRLQSFRRQVQRWPDQTWRSLTADTAAMTLRAGRHRVTFSARQYQVDGQPATVGLPAAVKAAPKKAATVATGVNRFTRWQGLALLIFILVTLFILTGFLIYGRRIYRNQFRRKGRKP